MQFANKTDVFNLTVLSLGQTAPIINADSDTTIQAKILRQWYPFALNKTLDRTEWRCWRKSAELSLLEEDYSETWLYRYELPADCHTLLKLGIENYFPLVDERAERKIPFELLFNGASVNILTNLPQAWGSYTAQPSPNTGMPLYFAETVSLILAESAAPALITNNWVKMKEAFLKDARQRISQLIATDLGQQPERRAPLSSFADARKD